MTTNSTFTLQLAATVPGQTIVVEKTDATAYTITVLPVGLDTIDGASSLVLKKQWDRVELKSDGAFRWMALSGGSLSTASVTGLAGSGLSASGGTLAIKYGAAVADDGYGSLTVLASGPLYVDLYNSLNVHASTDFVVSGGVLTQNAVDLAKAYGFNTGDFQISSGAFIINAVAVNKLIAGTALFTGTATFAYTASGAFVQVGSAGAIFGDNFTTPSATVAIASTGVTVAKGANSVQVTASGVGIYGPSGSLTLTSGGVALTNGSSSVTVTAAATSIVNADITITASGYNINIDASNGIKITDSSNRHLTMQGANIYMDHPTLGFTASMFCGELRLTGNTCGIILQAQDVGAQGYIGIGTGTSYAALIYQDGHASFGGYLYCSSDVYDNGTKVVDKFAAATHASRHAAAGADPVSLSAAQVSGLATVATSGSYSDLSSKPTLGTAASHDVGDFAAVGGVSGAFNALGGFAVGGQIGLGTPPISAYSIDVTTPSGTKTLYFMGGILYYVA